jgi:nicotinamide-nucleotide adenylyltransferase
VPYAPPQLSEVVEELDADGPLEARVVVPASGEGRVGLMPGSYNPPTEAHVALAKAGRAAGLKAVYYLLSKRTVNKEQVSGIPLDDRLELLRRLAEPEGDGVVFDNRGLYVDHAAVMRRALPRATELTFLVGFDKIVQIFDPRYYDDRDAALSELFDLASFLVAPRGESDESDLRALLDRPENRRFAERVRGIPLAEVHRHSSSTRVREGGAEDVPPVVADYLARFRPF